MIEIFFDGLCAPINPGGVATYGFVVYRAGKKLREGQGVVGEGKGMTNNVAEYNGILHAVDFVLKSYPGEKDITIRGDSQLVARQMAGEYKLISETARKYVPIIRHMLEGRNVKFQWIPREENSEADSLTKKAYERHIHAKKR